MDEVLDNREDLLYFDALGRWQTILNENGEYETYKNFEEYKKAMNALRG